MTVRIGVVGPGLIGSVHSAAVAASPSCELAAIAGPTSRATELAAQGGVPAYPDLGSLLAAERPDGVVLATPNQLHLDGALECMEAGVPVLVEKPLADTAQAARELHREAEQRRAVVLVGHHRTHSPIMRRARQIVDSGVLGDLVAVTGTALLYKPDDYFDQGPWRAKPGGGPILVNLIHEIHNLRMLCGDIVQVQALTSDAVRGFAVEDTAAIVFRFAGGALGTFLLSDTTASPRSWEQTSGENPDYPSHPDEDCYHLAGTRGSLSVPTMRLRVFSHSSPRSWYEPLQESVATCAPGDPIRLQIEHFAQVVRGRVAPACTTRDGALNVMIVDAIARSATARAAIDIDPI